MHSDRPTRHPGTCRPRPQAPLLLLAMAGLWVGACSHRPVPSHVLDTPVVDRQDVFRVRLDLAAEANQERGWAGAINEQVDVVADQPFRLRVGVRGGQSPEPRRFQLLSRRSGETEWEPVEAHDFPVPEEDSPTVSIVANRALAGAAATERLISPPDRPYRAGAALSLIEQTPPWSGAGMRGEWEWALVIRHFADDAVQSLDGSVFEFRLGDADGHPLPADDWPRLRLRVPEQHVGGTFVETPMRIGPWEAENGDLYFIMEPSETDNRYLMMKSSDRGRRWAEIDALNRPPVNDLEGVASIQDGALIHQLHQTSDAVWYYQFATSDHHETPDRWRLQAELVATPQEPPVQVVDLAVRSDGSVVALYGGPERVHLKIRTADGRWGAETVLDAEIPIVLSGPTVVRGRNDQVHLAYTGQDGSAWYRSLSPDNRLGPRLQVATGLGVTEQDVGSILPLVYLPKTDTVAVLYRLDNGELWSRLMGGDGNVTEAQRVSERSVAQNTVDSDQTAADIALHGDRLHVLFVEEASGLLYHSEGDGRVAWTPARRVPGTLKAQWVRGNVLLRGPEGPVYGFVYDAGSNGGSGFNRYHQLPLSTHATQR